MPNVDESIVDHCQAIIGAATTMRALDQVKAKFLGQKTELGAALKASVRCRVRKKQAKAQSLNTIKKPNCQNLLRKENRATCAS